MLLSTVAYWYKPLDRFFLPNNIAQIPAKRQDVKYDEIIFDCKPVAREVF